MKRLVTVIIAILLLAALAAAGCTNKELAGTSSNETEVVASSCITCHTDKDILKEVASTEAEETTSEATTGEG